MDAGTGVVTNSSRELMIGAISGADLNIALLNDVVLTSAQSYLREISNWTTLSAYEISGTGYTAGGVNLTTVSAYSTTANDYAYFNGNAVIWNMATISAYGYALYRSTSGLVVAVVAFGGVSSGNPKLSTSGPFSISWNSNQMLQMIG